MDEKRPKRRKDKYNPYTIFKTDEGNYGLAFRDGQNELCFADISEEIYELFDTFEREDLSYLNEVQRHYEFSDIWDENLPKRAIKKQESLEETVFKDITAEELHRAIQKLPELQKRRVVMYYFGDMTYEEIARMENCTQQAVTKSVHAAIKKLKKTLK